MEFISQRQATKTYSKTKCRLANLICSTSCLLGLSKKTFHAFMTRIIFLHDEK
jgi:hypothetical protein